MTTRNALFLSTRFAFFFAVHCRSTSAAFRPPLRSRNELRRSAQLDAPDRAAHSRALPEAGGEEHAAHPDLSARRLRLRALQGQSGRRLPARRVAAQVSRSGVPLPVWRASTGQSTGRAWLALGALPDATHARLRSRLGNPQGVAWRGPGR